MQRHGMRHFISYFITSLLYVGLAFAYFYSQSQHIVSSKKMEEKVIKMSLSTFEPEVVPPPKKIIEEVIEIPIVEKVVKKPKIQKLKPIIKKRVIKPKKKIVKKRVVKKKKTIKKHVVKKTSTKKRTDKKVVSKKKTSTAQKRKVINEIRAKIDRNKIYPRIAKKRGMQGSVKVKFTILPNGHVSNINITGKKVFYRSVRKAIEKVFPINPKNVSFSLPSTLTLTLHYRLR